MSRLANPRSVWGALVVVMLAWLGTSALLQGRPPQQLALPDVGEASAALADMASSNSAALSSEQVLAMYEEARQERSRRTPVATSQPANSQPTSQPTDDEAQPATRPAPIVPRPHPKPMSAAERRKLRQAQQRERLREKGADLSGIPESERQIELPKPIVVKPSATQSADEAQPASAPAQRTAEEIREEARRRREERLREIRERGGVKPEEAAPRPATEQPELSAEDAEIVRQQLEANGVAPADAAGQPAAGGGGGGAVAGEEARPVHPDDGRTEWFTFDDMPWEDVIKYFAERIGKPLIGTDTLVIVGSLTYKSDRRFTKEEAIDELNLLMQEQGYRFVEDEYHIRVLPLSEMPNNVPVDHTYKSVEEYRAADLRSMDYVTVFMQVQDRPASEIEEMFASALPDYARLSEWGSTNELKITATKKDIDRFLALYALVPKEEVDPLKVQIFEIKTNVTAVADMVRDLLGVEPPKRRYDPRTRQWVTEGGGDERFTLIPDERTNSLIVKGTPDQISQVQKFVDKLDTKKDIGEFKTHVVEVEHGNASEIARLLNEIFQQEQGQAQPTRRMPIRTNVRNRGRRAQRRVQPQQQQNQPTPQDIFAEDIFERAKKTVRLVADERTNSLIVYANDDGLNRVKELLEVIDKPMPSNFQTFVLENADAEQIQDVVQQFAQSMATQTVRRPGVAARAGGPTVILDKPLNALHVIADREEMGRIEEIIRQLDIPGSKQDRHVVELKKIPASRAAEIARPFLENTPGSTPRRSFRGRRGPTRGRSAANATAQLIPIDEASTLIIVCTEDEWAQVEPVIRLADEGAVSDTPSTRFFAVTNGNADGIANTISQMYRNYQHPTLGRSAVFVDALGDNVVVQAIEPALDEIEALIPSLDVADMTRPLVILPLEHAEAADVAELAQPLLRDSSGNRGRRRGRGATGDNSVQAEPVTNSLIIQADPATYEKVRDFALEMDQKVGAQAPERRTYALNYANPRDVVNAITNLFGGSAGRGRSRRGGPTQVKVISSDNQVIVEAPRDKLGQIDELVKQLDDPEGRDTVTTLVKLPGNDVGGIARNLSNAFRDRSRQQGLPANFQPDNTTETILVTIARQWQDEADELLAGYQEIGEQVQNQTQYYQLKNATAEQTVNWLRDQLTTFMQQQFGQAAARRVNVHADPRTNRIWVSAPQVAVKTAMALLEQYDVEADAPPPDITQVRTYALPGVDVNTLARNVQGALQNKPRRPDGLRAVVSGDPSTQTLIVSAPKDQFNEIEQLMSKFSADTQDMEPDQKVFKIQFAEAQYVGDQLRNLLTARIAGTRGRQAAQNLSVSIDPRLNQVFVDGPKFATKMAADLVTQLDTVAPPQESIYRITLENADAGTVANMLNDLLREKIRQKRNMRISPEPMSNSVLVIAGREDREEISKLVEQIDESAKIRELVPKLYEIKNVNPWEVLNVLNQTFSAKRGGMTQRLGTEMTFNVIAGTYISVQAPQDDLPKIEKIIREIDGTVTDVNLAPVVIPLKYVDPNQMRAIVDQMFGRGAFGSRSREKEVVNVQVVNNQLVVQAPKQRLEQIKAVVAELDQEDSSSDLQVRTYQLKLLNAGMVATQVQMYLRSLGNNRRTGQMQPGAFAEPTTNSLVVIAPAENLPFIEGLISKLELSDHPTSESKVYALKNARAEAVAENVDALLKAKVAEREGPQRKNIVQTSVFADAAGNRLFVYAPDDYQDLASDLIRMIDEEVDSGEIVHIINLQNADADQLARTLSETISGQASRGRRFGRRGGGGGGDTGRNVRVTADAGSNSLILSGLAKDVAWAEGLVKELESASDATPELQKFQLDYANVMDVEDMLRSLFPSGRDASTNVTVTTDEFSNTVMVTASRRKMRQVEEYIKQLDQPVSSEEPGALPGGRELYFVDIKRGDAYDIAYDVSQMFRDVDEGGPLIDSDWFGDYIKVVCRPSEFPAIEKRIREFESRARVEIKSVLREPARVPMDQMLPYLQTKFPGAAFEQMPGPKAKQTIVEELWDADEAPPGAAPKGEGQTKRNRDKADDNAAGAAKPASDDPAQRPAMLDDGGVVQFAYYAPPAASQPASATRIIPGARIDVEPPSARDARAAGETTAPATKEGEKLRFGVLPDGRILISGPETKVDEMEDAITLLEEDLAVGEVIRIFRFKYGDVNVAAQILDRMFNDPQVRMPQVRQPQPQNNQRGGRNNERGGEGQGGEGGMMDQIRAMMGGAAGPGSRGNQPQAQPQISGGQRVRIATEPSYNYLIVKCDESELPEIRRLLRELDVPTQKVDVRVFQLKALDAEETANNIRQVLGISDGSRGGGGRSPAARNARRGGPQQQLLMEMMQQQMVSLPGADGGSAKMQGVQIVPNRVTNSLMVAAPQEAMAVIEDVIGRLEDLEGRNVTVIRHYELTGGARVEDILPLLQEIFSATGKGRGDTPGDLGPVTLSGDPRSNAIIYSCETKDVQKVEDQIALLDIPGNIASAETYLCTGGDAMQIAQTVADLYVGGGRGGKPDPGTPQLRITAEPVTNAVLVWGPEEQRRLALEKVRELDALSSRDIQKIAVKHADAEKLAEKLQPMFASATGGGRGNRGGNALTERVMIVGDGAAKQLLVRAPKAVFDEIKQVVDVLDQPNDILIKRYTLNFADATTVVDSMKSAMTEYITLQKTLGGGGGGDFDAFTAVPDPRTNSVMVVGTEQTFTFIDRVLGAIDVDTPADQEPVFRVFTMQEVAAELVADAINAFASGQTGGAGNQPGGRQPGRSGGRGGQRPGAPGGGSPSGSEFLKVYAVADPSSNSVFVYGIQADIDKVQTQVIDVMETSIRKLVERIEVEHLPPSQVKNYLDTFLRAGEEEGGGPRIEPNDGAKTLVVWGTKAEISRIKDFVSKFDQPGMQLPEIQVIAIPFGQDVGALASQVETVVNDGERILAEAVGRQARSVRIVPNDTANALLVYGEPAMYGMVERVVKQLDEVRPMTMVTQVVELQNLSTDRAIQLISDLQKPSTSGRGGVQPTRRGGGSFNPGSRGGRSSFNPSGRSGRNNSGRGRSNRGDRRRGGDLRWEQRDLYVPPAAARRPAELGRTVILASSLRPAALALSLQAATQAVSDDDPNEAGAPNPPVESDEAAKRAIDAAIESLQRRQAQPAPRDRRNPPAGPAATPVNLPNVKDQGIVGELRGEVVAQPIDARRLLIQGDAQDVQYILRVLALMEQSAVPAEIQVFQLKYSNAAALAPIVTEAVKSYIDTRGTSPGSENNFSISAEGRSNSLIVSASTTNMDIIGQIIEQLDVDNLEAFTAKVVPLEHVRAAEVQAKLKPVIEQLMKQRDVPTESQPRIDAVDRTNSVMIVGRDRDIAEISNLVTALDVDIDKERGGATDFSVLQMRIVNLQNAKAEDVAKTLTDMIEAEQENARTAGGDQPGKFAVRKLQLRLPDGQELPALDLEKPIRVIPEKGTNSLVIFSTEENNNALAGIVDVFDTLPVGEEIDVKGLRLKYASATQVAEIVQKMFDEGKNVLRRPAEGEGGVQEGVMPPQPTGNTGRGLPYKVVVTSDPRSNSVFAIGRTDAVVLAMAVVNEMDVPSGELGLESHILPLKNMLATTLKDKLTELLDKRDEALGAKENKARDNVVLMPDDRTNSLLVMASPEMFKLVEDLATKLDSLDSHTVIDSEFRRLQFADAAKLQSLLQELYDKKKDAAGAVKSEAPEVLYVQADTRSNSLLLTGSQTFIREANQLIDKLDQKYDPTVVFRVQPIRLNSATNIADRLKEVIDKARTEQGEGNKGTPIYVGADAISNSLLIAASAEDVQMIERWVDVLDRPAEPGRVTRILPITRGKAEDKAKQAQDLFAQAGGSGGSNADLTVTSDATTNAVVAVGPPALVSQVEEFVTSLDNIDSSGAIVRTFKLEQADVEQIQELLTNILEGRSGVVGSSRSGGSSGGGSREDAAKQVMLIYQQKHPEMGVETFKALRSEVTVVADVRTNSLFVTASPQSMSLMESLIRALDVPPDSANIKILPLRNADAEQMVTMLQELFQNQGSSSRTGGGGSSNQNDQERILNLAGGEGVTGREQLSFTVDTRTNSVIAAGTPGYLDVVEDLVLKLDTQPIEDRKVLVYAPRNNEAVSIASSIKEWSDAEQSRLQELGEEISLARRQERQITAIANEDANVIIIDYSPRIENSVLDIVRELDLPPLQVMIQVLIVEVTLNNSLELGVEFAFQDLEYTRAGPNDTTTFDYVYGTDVGAAGSGLGGFTFTITGKDFNFLFRTLQSESTLRVLSRPQIAVMNNQEATIQIFDDVPYVTGSGTTFAGSVQTSVAREEIGIDLQVKPRINPDGYVMMEIRQEVSNLTDSTVDVGQGISAPIFFRRIAETVVTVKDNETIVLGGLITSRNQSSETKVPLVGDIPLLGKLFSSQSDEMTRTDLLVVLTPHVLRTPQDFRELSERERDRTGLMDSDILTDPLMEHLQVKPEELIEPENREYLGPFPSQNGAPNRNQEIGPLPPGQRPNAPARDESYDIPLTMVGQAAAQRDER